MVFLEQLLSYKWLRITIFRRVTIGLAGVFDFFRRLQYGRFTF